MIVEEDNYEPYCHNIYGSNYDHFGVIPVCVSIFMVSINFWRGEIVFVESIEDGENNDENMINNAIQ
jgi:hypothetical protein